MSSPSPPRTSQSSNRDAPSKWAATQEVEEPLLAHADTDRGIDASDHHVQGFHSKPEHDFNWYEKVGEDSTMYKCLKVLSCFDRFVIPESSSGRKLWELLLLVMLLYIGIVFPFRLAFCQFRLNTGDHDCQYEPEEAIWGIIEQIITVYFWIDLIINFLFTYRRDDDKEECRFVTIFMHYMSGFFWLNLVACLPPEAFNTIVLLIGVNPGGCDSSDSGISVNKAARFSRLQRVTRLARMTRLLRLFKIASFMRKSAIGKMMSELRAWRMINWVGSLCWVVHLLACGWYLCAALHTDHSETWVARRFIDSHDTTSLITQDAWLQWAHAMYFILTVFTTVGFGDMSAVTSGEIVYVSFVMLVGAVVHSIIISEMINLIGEVDEETKWKRTQKNLFEAFGKHARLHSDLTERLVDSVNDMEAGRSSFDREQMRKLLTSGLMPRKLLADMPEQLFDGHLIRNRFMKTCAMAAHDGRIPPRFSLLLSTMLSPVRYQAGEVVFQMNDHAFNMFFVMEGTFAYVADPSPAGGKDSTQLTANVAKVNAQHRIVCKCKPESETSTVAVETGAQLPNDDMGESIIRLDPPESQRVYSANGVASSKSLKRAFHSSKMGQQTSAWSVDGVTGQWLQMDLGSLRSVRGVIVQGHPLRDEWVNKFRVSVADNDRQQEAFQEAAVAEVNITDRDTVVEIDFAQNYPAKIVRIEPLKWKGDHISMRAGVMVIQQNLDPYVTFSKYEYFGEQILHGRSTRSATVRCEVGGHLLLLHKNDLVPGVRGVGLLGEFPQFSRLLRTEARRREARRRRALKKLTTEWPEPALLHHAAAIIQLRWRNRNSDGDKSGAPASAEAEEEQPSWLTSKDMLAQREEGLMARVKELDVKVSQMQSGIHQLRAELGDQLRNCNAHLADLAAAVQSVSPLGRNNAER